MDKRRKHLIGEERGVILALFRGLFGKIGHGRLGPSPQVCRAIVKFSAFDVGNGCASQSYHPIAMHPDPH